MADKKIKQANANKGEKAYRWTKAQQNDWEYTTRMFLMQAGTKRKKVHD